MDFCRDVSQIQTNEANFRLIEMAIKLELLRTFCAVAESGSLVEAADRLGRTPSAVSMALSQLEAHLGQRLFESDRKNRLSPLGSYVAEQARREIGQFDATISAIEAFAGAPGGLVRIAAVPSVAAPLFPGIAAALRRDWPQVRAEFRDGDSESILRDVARGQVEIGIATTGRVLAGVQQERLLTDAFGLVCAQDHPLARAHRMPDLAALARAGFVANDLCRGIDNAALAAMVEDAQVVARNTISLVAMVASGDWVTVLPRSVVGLDPGRLGFRAVRGLNAHRTLDLLTRPEGPNPGLTGEVAALIRAEAAQRLGDHA
jgi:DNA-binding transcriptional LysR family regulator